MQKITPNLWFDDKAEEAANFYVSVFKNIWPKKESAVISMMRYGKAGAQAAGRPEGSVMTATFQLAGQRFVGINGGPVFKFNEAVSFMIECKNQKEIDAFWEALSQGGSEGPCGWLKDKYGLSWQVVPKMMNEPGQDPEKNERMMKAMFQMKKLDIKALKKAYKG